MPPVDPSLLPPDWQQSQPRTLATPPPYYSGPSANSLPSATLPQGSRVGDPYAGPRYDLSAAANARAAAKSPAEISSAQTNAEVAKLELRKKRMEQGLDPDTGKPAAANLNGAVGEQAISDLSEGEKDIVKGITQGRVPVTSLGMSRNPTLFKLVQRAFAYEPGTDLTTFARRQAAFQKFMSNPNSPMVRVNQALQHLDRFHDNAHELNNYHSGFFGSLANYPRAAMFAIEKDPKYQAFATDRDALATELAAAFQGTGSSALEDRKHWQSILSAANSPESFDQTIKEAVGLLGGRVEASNAQFKQAVGANADFYDLMSPGARKVYDKFSNPDFGTPAADVGEKKLSTDTKAITFPKGYQDEHKAYLDAHRGNMTVQDYTTFRKSMDEKYGIKEADLDPDETKKYVEGVNKGRTSTELPPLGEKKLSPLASSWAGAAESAPGTFVGNLTNAGTAGLVDLASGQEGRDAEKLANAENWKSALGGELIGSVVGMGGLERGSAKLAAKLGVSPDVLARVLGGASRGRLAADVGVNAAYGGARGFSGADEGSGGEGALQGAAGGTLGALGGNVVTKGLTPLLSDVTAASLQKLKGVDMTTLQRLGIGRAEESLSGVPFAHGARQAAMRSMNVDNADRVLANIGVKVPRTIFKKSLAEPGTDLNAYVNSKINEAYNKVRPKIFGAADGQFDNAISAIQASATTPEKKAMFQEIKDAVDQFKDPVTGLYNGDGYQAASMRLRSLVKDFSTQAENSGSISARDMARAAEQARKQMQFQVQRTAPEVATELKGVERAYAHSMRLEDATNRALTASETGVYSPGQLLTSIKKLDTSMNKGATARGKAFDQQYAEAAAKVLGHGNVPKISVKETGVAAAALGLGGYASPHVAAFFAAAGAGIYGPGVKRITQKLLSGQRPKAIDNEIVRRALSDYIRHQETGD